MEKIVVLQYYELACVIWICGGLEDLLGGGSSVPGVSPASQWAWTTIRAEATIRSKKKKKY